MIPIYKQPEPPELTVLRQRAAADGATPAAAYARLKGNRKEIVKRSLLLEQGKLCAYCMCGIPRNDVEAGVAPIILEHIIPRNPADGRDVGQGLDYSNLVLVCNGNKAQRGKRKMIDFTCDAYKGNRELRKVHPCKPETLSSIFYQLDGVIDARDPNVKYDLNRVLNLNAKTSPLIAERRAALEELIEDMGTVEPEDLLLYCEQRLVAFQKETEDKTPYQGILIWYLKEMAAALAAM